MDHCTVAMLSMEFPPRTTHLRTILLFSRAGMHRGTLTLLMFCFMALLIGCAPQAATTAPESGAGVLSAWIVDWDLEQGLEEWKAQRDVLRNVYAFGAYFDARGDVFLAAPWVRLLAGGASCWNGPPPQCWLTVVNDRVTAQGAVQKDPELVRALLSNPLFRRRYMQTFTTLVATYGFQGLELDFEKVYPADWPHYLRFCSQLAEILRRRNIAFRVVLQPQRAYISDVLPKDLDYCVMGYNLYGHHSGPGPKATPDFYAQLRTCCVNRACSTKRDWPGHGRIRLESRKRRAQRHGERGPEPGAALRRRSGAGPGERLSCFPLSFRKFRRT